MFLVDMQFRKPWTQSALGAGLVTRARHLESLDGVPIHDFFGNCQFSSDAYDFVHNYLRIRGGANQPFLGNTKAKSTYKLVLS